MKQCRKCNQVYADDLLFCLSDGTPLVSTAEDNEQHTVVRPGAAPITEQPTVFVQRGASVPPPASGGGGGGMAVKIGGVLAGLVLLLVLIGGAAAAYLFWPRDVARVTNNTPDNANARSMPLPSPAQTSAVNASTPAANSREAELERERKRLADERKKLEDERRRLDEEDNEDIPADDDPPPPPAFKDPGPSRIAFGRGSTGTTVSGTVGRARSYMLRAMDGQYLNASVRSAGGCVIFSSGGASTQFSTGAGDTYLYLRNTCSSPAKFSMSVTVR